MNTADHDPDPATWRYEPSSTVYVPDPEVKARLIVPVSLATLWESANWSCKSLPCNVPKTDMTELQDTPLPLPLNATFPLISLPDWLRLAVAST